MTEERHTLSPEEAEPPFFVGLDLGGTNIKAGVVDNLGRSMSHCSVPTEADRGAKEGAKRLGSAVGEAISRAGVERDTIARVGLGSPGTMDIPKGMLIKPVNLKGWDNFPIRDHVSEHCGLPVAFINDAAAAAYGEFWVGAGRNFHSLVLFTLGTGVGCGIIIGDLSIDGENSHGAECGHMIIDYAEDARLCGCGRPGHLEAYASATALTRRALEAVDTRLGKETPLTARIEEEANKPEDDRKGVPQLVGEEAARGDPLSLRLVREVAQAMGVGIVNLMHTIDPNAVLLGGAMTFDVEETDFRRRFLDWIKEEVAQRAFGVLAKETIIDFASLGGDAGYIGAAGIARLEHQGLRGE